MPHFKCMACKTRFYNAASPPDPVGDLCPGCGSLLEPAGSLSELVGFRTIVSRDVAATADTPATRQRVTSRVDDFLARRHAILTQAQLDDERWDAEGESLQADAVALPRPEPVT